MLIDFPEAELETIAAAMDDYIAYADADINFEDLIGGIPVAERVDSIIDIMKAEPKIFFNLLQFISIILQ